MRPNLHLNLNRNKSSPYLEPNVTQPAAGSCVTPITPSGYCTPVNTNFPSILQLERPSFPGVSRSSSPCSSTSDLGHDFTKPSNQDPTQHMSPIYHCNSVSSMASSIGGGQSASAVNMNSYDFTPAFDDALLDLYHSYANAPSVTPFNMNFPPSGLCSKISKQMYLVLLRDRELKIDNSSKKSEELMLEANRFSCLAVIRKRLLELCNSNADQTIQIASRNDSSVSLTTPTTPYQPVIHRPSWLHQNLTFNAARISSTDSLVDSVQLSADGSTQQQQFQQQTIRTAPASSSSSLQLPGQHSLSPFAPPNYSRKQSYSPHEMVTPPSSSRKLSTGSPLAPLFPNACGNGSPRLSSHGSVNKSGSEQEMQSDVFTFETYKPLQSPFKQNFSPSKVRSRRSGSRSSLSSPLATMSSVNESDGVSSDPLFNITAQRKRDSLNMKRNMM